MGVGLSKRKRVADYSPEFEVPVVYENVANLQKQMDSYMPTPAVDAIVTAHVTASRRNSKRKSMSREPVESVERPPLPKKEHPVASVNRTSQITSELRSSVQFVERPPPPKKEHSVASVNRTSQITPELRTSVLVCYDVERPTPSDAVSPRHERSASVVSLGSDVVLSPLQAIISLEKAVALLGNEATAAAFVALRGRGGLASSFEKAVAVLGDEATAAAIVALRASSAGGGLATAAASSSDDSTSGSDPSASPHVSTLQLYSCGSTPLQRT